MLPNVNTTIGVVHVDNEKESEWQDDGRKRKTKGSTTRADVKGHCCHKTSLNSFLLFLQLFAYDLVSLLFFSTVEETWRRVWGRRKNFRGPRFPNYVIF